MGKEIVFPLEELRSSKWNEMRMGGRITTMIPNMIKVRSNKINIYLDETLPIRLWGRNNRNIRVIFSMMGDIKTRLRLPEEIDLHK